MFETSRKIITLNILFSLNNKKEIKQGYISKYNPEPIIKLILLMQIEKMVLTCCE